MTTEEITAEAAAERIGCTVGRVYQLHRDGTLRGRRIHARAIVLEAASVDEYAAKPQTTGRPRVSPR